MHGFLSKTSYAFNGKANKWTMYYKGHVTTLLLTVQDPGKEMPDRVARTRVCVCVCVKPLVLYWGIAY